MGSYCSSRRWIPLLRLNPDYRHQLEERITDYGHVPRQWRTSVRIRQGLSSLIVTTDAATGSGTRGNRYQPSSVQLLPTRCWRSYGWCMVGIITYQCGDLNNIERAVRYIVQRGLARSAYLIPADLPTISATWIRSWYTTTTSLRPVHHHGGGQRHRQRHGQHQWSRCGASPAQRSGVISGSRISVRDPLHHLLRQRRDSTPFGLSASQVAGYRQGQHRCVDPLPGSNGSHRR